MYEEQRNFNLELAATNIPPMKPQRRRSMHLIESSDFMVDSPPRYPRRLSTRDTNLELLWCDDAVYEHNNNCSKGLKLIWGQQRSRHEVIESESVSSRQDDCFIGMEITVVRQCSR